jgi:hypothetical protein
VVFGHLAKDGTMEEEAVRLEVRPIGAKGQLAVDVWISAEDYELAGGEWRPDGVYRVQLSILTTYERLRRFAGQLIALARGERTLAELGGEVLA